MKILIFCFLLQAQVVFAQSLLPLLENHNIVFYGEQHYTEQHHDPIFETLEEGIKNGKLNTFATEYVPSHLNELFQRYLTDMTATEGSDNEKVFFEALGKNTFTIGNRNKNFYRKLRDLKLKYGEELKVCGIDFQISVEEEFDENFMLAIYQKLPESLQLKIQELSKRSLAKLSQSEERWYREAHMGLNIHNCYDKANQKGVVHVGGYHAFSVKTEYADNEWWTASKYLNLLREREIFTVWNLITFKHEKKDLDGDSINKMREQIYCAANLEAPKIFSSEALPDNIEQIMVLSEEETDGTHRVNFGEVYDAFIFGPLSRDLKRLTDGD